MPESKHFVIVRLLKPNARATSEVENTRMEKPPTVIGKKPEATPLLIVFHQRVKFHEGRSIAATDYLLEKEQKKAAHEGLPHVPLLATYFRPNTSSKKSFIELARD